MSNDPRSEIKIANYNHNTLFPTEKDNAHSYNLKKNMTNNTTIIIMKRFVGRIRRMRDNTKARLNWAINYKIIVV